MEPRDFFRRARRGSFGPLEGVRVLDVTKVWAGPMTSAVLGDLGADVIRIERPDRTDGPSRPRLPGTRLSWFRESVHRNKRSLALDLREPAGRERLLELVEDADVLVENYKPGTLDGWGLGYEACRARRPDLVMVSISGYGQYGPGAHRPAYDPVIQAAMGLMALNGEPGGAPLRAPTFVADDVAALHGAIGALAALAHRHRTGEGQHVDVAMADCVLATSSGLPALAAGGASPERHGNETDFVAPSNVYACRDGHVYLTVALDRHWRRLCEVMDRPELGRAPGLATASERLDSRPEVNRLVAAWCADHTVSEVVADAEQAGLVVSPVRDLAAVVTDEQVAAREMLPEMTLCDGSRARLVAPPVKFSRTPTRLRRSAPAPGADSTEILRELGPGRNRQEERPTTANLGSDHRFDAA